MEFNKKFRCIECKNKYKTNTKKNFKWCPSCHGSLEIYINLVIPSDQNEIKRQWVEALGPGWPYEVWDSDVNSYTIVYFQEIVDGKIYFRRHKKRQWHDEILYEYTVYRPLSTPLDFLFEKVQKAHFIEFDRFKNYRDINIYFGSLSWKFWPECPEGVKEKILAIPKDWTPRRRRIY